MISSVLPHSFGLSKTRIQKGEFDTMGQIIVLPLSGNTDGFFTIFDYLWPLLFAWIFNKPLFVSEMANDHSFPVFHV